MREKLNLFDLSDIKDEHKIISGRPVGEVIITNKYTGETVLKKKNKIILPGSCTAASNQFDIPILHTTPTYNEKLQLENSIVNTDPLAIRSERVYLFCIGTDGCGPHQSQVYDVNYGMWCPPDKLVPFRTVNIDNDLSTAHRERYFGRVKLFNNSKIAYYFKGFDAEPTWHQRYVSDNTPITSGVYDTGRLDEIVSYVELKMSVDEDDVREWFALTTGVNHALINTISLLTASYTTIGDIRYYQDIRPYTKINFPNEPLVDVNKGLDILYRIYY